MKQIAKEERETAIADLLKLLKPGSRVGCIVRHVSRSGMQREISLYIATKAGEMVCLDWYAARALGYRRGRSGGLIVGGCGMDMCFHTVYNLGRTLWPNGTAKPHGKRNGQPDRDGGYALKADTL